MGNEGIIMLGLLIICGIVGRVVVGWGGRRNELRFPPGPFAWPVIGHLQVLFSHLPHQALTGLSKKYGDVIGLRLGQQRAVVVSSPQLAKEVLLTHDKLFAYRPLLDFNSTLLFGPSTGIIFNQYGPAWRKHRKICMLHLFTAKRLHHLQYVRQEELRALLLSILHQSSSAGTTAIDLGKCVGNMASRLILRLLHSTPTIQLISNENLQQLIRDVEQALLPSMGDFIPSLSCLDIFKKQHMRRIHARLDKVLTEMLMERKESPSLHDDLLHALLSEEESLTVVEIKSILIEMIGAGINTTALTIEWAMAELLRNPDCLRQLQREIDTQLGEKKQIITDADLPELSYLKCVIKEASRLHPVLPLLIPRMSIEECKVQGYTIPAKTLMYVNVWAIGRDERVWPNANEFMPQRFESKDIDLKGQHFELLPFGSGRRACLGISLAVPLIELILANLVSCFDWELPYGETHKSINMDERRGFTANRATPVIAIPKPRLSLSNLPCI